jgi:hypothetical protein
MDLASQLLQFLPYYLTSFAHNRRCSRMPNSVVEGNCFERISCGQVSVKEMLYDLNYSKISLLLLLLLLLLYIFLLLFH